MFNQRNWLCNLGTRHREYVTAVNGNPGRRWGILGVVGGGEGEGGNRGVGGGHLGHSFSLHWANSLLAWPHAVSDSRLFCFQLFSWPGQLYTRYKYKYTMTQWHNDTMTMTKTGTVTRCLLKRQKQWLIEPTKFSSDSPKKSFRTPGHGEMSRSECFENIWW